MASRQEQDDDDFDDDDVSEYFDDVERAESKNEETEYKKPDADYEGELGYALVKSLRGKTTGRRFKRNLFKYGFFQLTCGGALTVICGIEAYNYPTLNFFSNVKYGASLQDLMWCASVPSVILGIFTWIFVRYWASFCTNRQLLGDFFKFWLLAHILLLVFVIWCTLVVFYTFKDIKDWGANVTLAAIRGYYVASLLFLIPYGLVSLFYLGAIFNLIREVDNNGDITEPNVHPEDVMDLSDLTLTQSCVFVCAMPCIVCIQFTDFLYAARKAIRRHYNEIFPPKKKTKRSIWKRIYKTLHRLIRGKRSPKGPSVTEKKVGSSELELQNLDQINREAEEREERERVEREREERRLEEARAAAEADERRKRAQAEAQEAARLENERLRRELEKQEQEQEAQRQSERERISAALTLSANQYKIMWAALSTAGSFQCKLKAAPQLLQLTAHLKSQGFHVVFATTPADNEIEVGISNIRFLGTEPWFMARFVSSQSTFSAVMKAEDSNQVTSYVKKFALAKVLKIDSGGQSAKT